MQYVKLQAKSREEALEKSGMYVGQPAKVSKLTASGNLKGEWVIRPEFEVVKEESK